MIKQLLLLNGLAVLAAVGQHASSWGFISLFWWTDRYQPVTSPDFSQLGGPAYLALRALEQLTIFAPPAFLFVSGVFVAFALGREGLDLNWVKVGNRIKTLLIPYVVWSVVIFVWRGIEGSVDTPAGYLEQLLFGGAAAPFYYVPLIIQFYLIAPFIVTALRASWKPVLLAAIAIQVGVQLAYYPVLLGWDVPAANWISRHAPGWFIPQTMFWFVFGVFAGFHLSTLRQWLTRWQGALPWVTAALGVLAMMEWELLLRLSGQEWIAPTPTALDSLFSFALILTCLAFAQSNIPMRHQLNALGERSFGVYLVHAPVIELLSRAAYHLTPRLLGHQFVFQPLVMVAGVGVPVLLMAMVNRSPARPYYSYLFG